jgi:hypothetical protein
MVFGDGSKVGVLLPILHQVRKGRWARVMQTGDRQEPSGSKSQNNHTTNDSISGSCQWCEIGHESEGINENVQGQSKIFFPSPGVRWA